MDMTDDTGPIADLKTMFVDLVMGRRIAKGQVPALRPVFLKTHGIAVGTFRVCDNLPSEVRIGLFRHRDFPAVVRFSSDTVPTAPDAGTTLGIAIKLFGVPGPKLLHEAATTCDFLMQNHPVFFVDTAADMAEFTHAGVVDGNYQPYLDAHPTTARILQEMQRLEPSVLRTTYWGLLPHALGSANEVKYKLVPRLSPTDTSLTIPQWDNYLYFDLKTRLLRQGATFDLFVQRRTHPDAMPVDRATVRWDENESAPIRVARLELPPQNIDAVGQATFGERLSFNIWQTLVEHKPIGSIATARKSVYLAAGDLRRSRNGVPLDEPEEPFAAMSPSPALASVVRAAIHPAIGIARVGNSTKLDTAGYFVGPEVPDEAALGLGQYKDDTGALKRQAARFRLYGYDAAGAVVAELTAENAVIEWTVHVANKKAAWYQFQLALDIPAATQPGAPVSRRRNPAISGKDRAGLIIDPGARSIHGRDTSGSTWELAGGSFLGLPVSLGELRTDDMGRLLMLGGHGKSESIAGLPPLDFANNDGWHDDVSDGPVEARVTIGGKEIPVEGAWVVVAPPNYAPALKTVRTLYDVLFDAGVRWRWFPRVERPSFAQHIQPIFERLTGLQWVNNGFASVFGAGAPYDALNLTKRLADGSKANAEFRQNVVRRFRRTGAATADASLWPFFYGDGIDNPASAESLAPLTPTQLQWLQQWADGDFAEDLGHQPAPWQRLDDAPLAQRPALLDRAALDFCLADAFHPGCELTWIVRRRSLYSGPLRLRRRPPKLPEPDYGDVLAPDVAIDPNGPLSMSGPGDLTRWMAVPWQTDTASCLSGYTFFKTTDSLPTFWPVRVPNQVLRAVDFEKIVLDSSKPMAERLRAFRRREDWFRGFDKQHSIAQMITGFSRLGIVEERDGPTDLDGVPNRVWVESTPALPDPAGVASPEAEATAAPAAFYALRNIGKGRGRLT